MIEKIERTNVEGIFELSMVQKGMLYHYLKEDDQGLYNVQLSFDIRGQLELNLLQQAFDEVQAANQVLRSVFRWSEVSKPVQIILHSHHLPIAFVDFSQQKESRAQASAGQFLQEDLHKRLDLARQPLRLTVLRVAEQQFVLVITHHHILYDGWSTAILLKELFRYYNDLAGGRHIVHVEKPAYGDVYRALAQRVLQGAGDTYWKNHLSGYPVTACFPKTPVGDVVANRLQKRSFHIAGLDVKAFSALYGVTGAAIIYAAYGVLLRHWFHAEDIVFGTAVSTRDETIRGLEMVMGNFINTVPLRMAPAADETFAQLTIRVNKALLERSDYCNTSYAEIKKLLDLKPSEDLFDTVIAVENYPVTGATTAHAGWDVRLRAVYEHTGIPLVVTVFFNEALELECTYDAELVNEAFIGYLETYFGRVLRQGLHHPGQAVCFSDLISAAERKYLTQELNDTAVSYPQRDTIISLFEQQVKRTPGNTALRCGNLSLTYMELQSAIHKTAAFLKSNAGINAGDLVGVMLPREIQLLPVIFGILKAGAVYVPIDPDFPAERVNAVAGDAGLKAMITRAGHVKASLPAAIALIDPDEAAAWSDDSPVDFPAVDGNDLAYVIYTSGSTGKPKGVMVEHRSVVNRITWMQQQYPLTEDDVLLQKTPLVFDVSIWELYWWSFTGASLYLPEPGAEKDPAEIIRAIQEHGVTTIHFVPSMLNAFLATMNDGFNFAAIKRLRQVFTSGEALMPAQVQLFADTLHKYCGSRLINLYGPTEATVDVSFYECSFEHEYHVVPIGKPINNVRLYILGKDQSLLPAGAVGELCIAGVGLARGYLGREALTAEKFTQCPALPGERIYRTGDLARWLPDGNIAFLGRQDEQVKIRGVRIEPGEVASHLLAHTHITEAAVVARERNGEKYLVAYYVSDSPLERKDLRDWLSRGLPEYMVPAWYVHLRAMPLTVSGKLDRNMLPEPTALTDFSEEGDAPANETEQKLAQLWQEVLGHAYVNTDSSFFDTGGDSLQALRLINRIGKQFDVELPLKTLFDNPTIKSLAACLRARTEQHAGRRGRLFKTEKRQYYPLSSVQKRLYFLYQFDKSSLAYNAPLALRITGPVDKSRMTEALQELVRRNENLRTLFVTVNGEPYQKILDSVTVMMEEYRSDGNTSALLQQFIRPFDVGIAPLMRAGWIECEEEEHILLLDLHHIITDGVSQGLLVRELMALYQGTSVAAPVFQYRDYAAWQNSAGYQAVVSGSREFWINEFAEEPPVLGLPLDFKRPLIRSYEGANVHFSLGSRETAMLKALGDAEGATMFMVVLSLFSILLGKLAAEEDVVIGTPASGRDHADLEAVMGMFVNTVVIRTRPQGEIPFRSFLREIRSRTLAVFDRQAYPYELLIDDLKVSRDTSRNPLFDVWFVYQNFETAVPEMPGLTITPCEIGAPISQFDISLTAGEREGRLHLNFEYSTELFSAETIDRFIGYFRAIVTAITGNAGCRLRDIGLVGPAERRLLLHTFNETETPFERQKTFFTLFQEQAQGTPEYPAVVYNGAQLTYSALLKRATDLSAYLAAKGIGRGSRVALYMSRGIDMLTAILGTFGAGAAYVPVEMEYPPHRVMEILADSEPGIVLVDDQTLSAAEAIKSKVPAVGEILSVSHMEQWSADEDAVPEVAGPDDIAYIIYTSGTTGKPKGAMVHQQGMLNHLYAMIEAMGPGNGDVIAQTASCSFDISVWQFLCALLVGGQTCIIDKDTQLDAGSLLREMQESKVTIAEMVPSLLRAFVDEAMNNAGKNHLPCLRWMIPTAEQISTALVNKWYDCYPGVPLINAYGPAEASDDVTLYFIGKDVAEGEIIPIGKPVRNTRIYITDQYMNLCPLGVRGEICIAGISVGKGYWKDQEKTLRAFVPNPFSGDGEEDYRYLYRTGDTGYYRPDGNIVFTGRRDDQVKVRGHRIECREIESHLLQWPGIREVTVLPREKNGAQYLVAYYIADTALEDAVLRGFLSGRLPDYMVPSFYVWLNRMPLTVNGKLDKKALPVPEHKQAPVDNGQVLTVEEKLLVEVWSKVLAADGISVTDNFFAVGGDSIRSTQIVSALRSAGYELSVKDIFIHQTIRELAVRLKRTGKQADQSAVVGRAALTPIQRLFFETPFARRHHYNQSVMLLFPDGLGADRARQMLAMLQEHHDALRMVFAEEAEGVFMHNQGPELAVSLEEYDLRGEPEAEASLLARCDEIQAGIDLAAGPLLRGGLFHLAEGSRLLLVVHHLVVDGVSWRILLEDMHTLYGQQQRNEPLQLPGKTDAFLLWPSRLSEYSAGKAFAKGCRYWNTFDAGAYPVLNRDYPEGTNKTGGQQVERFRLSRQLTGRLLGEAHRSFGTRINDLLLAGLLLGMHRCYQQPGILLDLESHGREELLGADISRTVGWFTSIYPVWLSGDVNNLTRLVREVKETLRRVPNNGIDYMIRQYVCNSVEHTHRRSRVIFNYLGQFDTAVSGEYFTAVSGAGGREIWEGETAEYDWEVSGMVLGGELEMTLTYSPRQYAADRVRIFMQSYRDALEEITEACCRHGKVELSPSDLVYKSLTLSQVDALQSEHALENIYPLSPMQEGMLFHALYDREGDQYFEQLSCRLQGRLDIAAVEHAMNGIIARYAILRTQFVHEGYERPLQIVYRGRRMKVSYEDMREACVQEGTAAVVDRIRQQDRSRKFDLGRDVLMRVTVLRLAASAYELIWSYHHVLMDGWCMGIIMRDFKALYQQYSRGSEVLLPAVRPYGDYISWLEERDAALSAQYWKEYLSGFENLTGICSEYGKVEAGVYQLKREELLLDAAQTDQLRRLSVDNGVTVNTVLQVAWGILLSKYNQADDVVFGAVVSGRPAELADVESMVGLFINTVPVRISYGPEEKISSLLRRVQEAALAAEPHHYHPLSEIQAGSTPGRSLLDHIMVFENYPLADTIMGPGQEELDFRISDLVVHEQTNYNLSVVVASNEKTSVTLHYNAHAFDKGFMKRVAGHFQLIITQLLNNSAVPVSAIEILTAEERYRILHEFNRPVTVYPQEMSLVDMFEKSVRAHPGRTALRCNDVSLTYSELNNRAGRVASYLATSGVTPGAVVGLMIERSPEMIIAMLGILKAGAAYLPLEAGLPYTRNRHLLEETNAVLLLTEEKTTCLYADFIKTADVRCLPEHEAAPGLPGPQSLAGHTAYIIYTSGSTGKPKGVMVSHHSVVNLVLSQQRTFDIDEQDRILQFSTICFDASVEQIWLALSAGAALVLIERERITDNDLFNDYISAMNVTHLHATPSFLENITLKIPNNVKRVIAGGEQCKVQTATRFYRDYDFYNEYGPTETTVTAIQCLITDMHVSGGTIPVGRPLDNTRVYILGKNKELLPEGIKGELFIAGDGLAAGYVNDPVLTRQRFVPDPFMPGGLMYRTGDLACWLPDGNLVFLGRADEQVKIRGFRIEPGEIENRLSMYQGVKEAVVTAHDRDGSKYLVAYYVAEQEIDMALLRAFLSETLPDYMVPAYYLRLPNMPLTTTGKLDRKALPSPDVIGSKSGDAPSSEAERVIAVVWSEVLGIADIGVAENFFAAGGDSIKSIQIVSRLRTAGYSLSVKDIFSWPTVRLLAANVAKAAEVPANRATVVGRAALTPIQRLFFETPFARRHHYNQSVMLLFPDGLGAGRARQMLAMLQEHHDALRMVFAEEAEGVFMHNQGPELAVSLEEYDLRGEPEAEASLLARCDEIQAGIDLAAGPLLRGGLFHLAEGSRLLLVVHHLVVDGVSWRILLEDMHTLYGQQQRNEPLQLPGKTDAFLLWPSRLSEYSAGKAFAKGCRYWNTFDAGAYPVLNRDYPEGTNKTGGQQVERFRLSRQLTGRLLGEAHRSFGTRINDLLLAGLLLGMHRCYQQPGILLDLESHGREELLGADISRTVGWFTSIYPVWLSGDVNNLTRLVREVKETLRRVPNNGIDYMIRQYVCNSVEHTHRRSRVIFNYLGQFDTAVSGEYFTAVSGAGGREIWEGETAEYDWEVSGMVLGGELEMTLTYNPRQYAADRVRIFMQSYRDALEEITEACCRHGKVELSPSDLVYKSLTLSQVDALQSEHALENIYPLSPMQEGMLFHALYDREGDQYFEQLSCRLQGRLDIAAVEHAMNGIIARYAILRTQFVHEGYERPLQIVYRGRRMKVSYEDMREACVQEGTAAVVDRIRQQDRSRKFDLGRDVLMRVTVLRLAASAYELIWSYHHVLMDGWCMGIIMRDFKALYQQYSRGSEVLLPAVRPYGDYISWLEERDAALSAQYWKEYLSGFENMTGIIPEHGKAEGGGYELAKEAMLLGEERTGQLHRLAIDNGVTINTVLQVAWGILLSKYNQADDVVFGAVVSGRPAELADVESMVGLFINTVPVRISYGPEEKISSLLRRVQEAALSAEPHHYHPLSEIQAGSAPGRLLLDHIMVFDNYPLTALLAGTDADNDYRIESIAVFERANYDLALVVTPGENISIRFEYNKRRYEDRQIRRVVGHMDEIIRQLAGGGEINVPEISILSAEEQQRLLYLYNDTGKDYADTDTIVSLFERQAAQVPEHTALVFEDISLTYSELDRKCNRLAHILKTAGAGKGDIVAIICDRSPEMIISLMAVLKVGAVYLPVDPGSPEDRIGYILADSGASIILTDQGYTMADFGIRTIAMHVLNLEGGEASALPPVTTLNDAAYIIYTSGSTGRPKGTVISQSGVIRLTREANYIRITGRDRILQLSSFAFDGSVFDIFGALLNGATLFMIRRQMIDDLSALARLIQEKQISVFFITTALFNILIEEQGTCLTHVRRILFGGERVSVQHVRKAFELLGKERLIHVYGPTEATVFSTFYPVNEVGSLDTVPIGRPITNTGVYILDSRQQLVPEGVAGELCISGAGLSLCYLNNEALTSQKFVANPYTGERIYRSGDLARWLPDGNIAFLGRIDDQVKVRGFRIELGEIEMQLARYEGIREVAVLAAEGKNGRCLAAYYVADEEIAPSSLKRFLSARLPDYMVPAHFMALAKFPLNVNGKLDKKALPDVMTEGDVAYVMPVSAEEECLARIWSAVLGCARAGVDSNFFALGGDSIKSIQVVSRVRAEGYELSVNDVFVHQTIRELAVVLKKKVTVADQSVVTGKSVLTPVQRMFFEMPLVHRHHYNQSVMLLFSEGLSVGNARKILSALMTHHDALRMVFREEEEGICMYNQGLEMQEWITEDDFSNAADEAALLSARCNEIQAGIDLSAGPLLRAGLFHVAEGSRLLIVVHHLVVDGVSWRILLEDIGTLHGQLLRGEPLLLPEKTDAFLSWPSRLSDYTAGKAYTKACAYWASFDAQAYPPLKRDFPEGTNRADEQEVETFELAPELTSQLLGDAHRRFGTRINDLLLAGLLLGIRRCYQQHGILLDLEGHGREEVPGANISRTVGWFTSIYPVLLASDADSLSRVIREVKELLRHIPNNGIDYTIWRYQKGNTIPGDVRSRISFNYLGQFDTDITGKTFSVSDDTRSRETSLLEEGAYDWEISGRVVGGRLTMQLVYSTCRYNRETITALMESYRNALEEITSYCCSGANVELTPSDLTFKDLTLPQLESLQQQYELEDIYPMAPMQEGMLFHALMEPEAEHYFDQLVCSITGPLDIALVEKAMNAIIHRYAILRTVFLQKGQQRPLQAVLKERKMTITFTDARKECLITPAAGLVEQYRLRDRQKKFNLEADMLMRLSIIRIADEEYRLIWSFHHILMDGWCIGIILNEFREIYAAYETGRTVALPAVREYSRYIAWLESRDKALAADYWKNYLASYDTLTSFRDKTSRQQITIPYQQRIRQLVLSAEQVCALQQIAADHHITVNTLLQASWSILLAKYNNVRDVVFGCVVSGRPAEIAGVEEMVGLFINTVPVRVKYEETDTVLDLLKGIQARALQSEPHYYHPLPDIQSLTTTGQELFDHIMVFENYPESAGMVDATATENGAGYSITDAEIFEQANYSLSVVIIPAREMTLKFYYDATVYTDEQIETLMLHLGRVVTQVVTTVKQRVADLEIVSPQEKQQLLYAFNDMRLPFEHQDTVVALFTKRAATDPDSTAIRFEGRNISYRQLHNKACCIARQIDEKLGGRGKAAIGLLCAISPEMVAGMLGILLAGCTYVPLSPDASRERNTYMLGDCGAALLVVQAALQHGMPAGEATESLVITGEDGWDDNIAYQPAAILPEDIIYIIYTSGTTGKPKGVAVTQRGISNMLCNYQHIYQISPGMVFSQIASITFDAAAFEIWPALTSGGCLCMAPEYLRTDAALMQSWLMENRVEITFLPTALAEYLLQNEWPGAPPSLRVVNVAGDRLKYHPAGELPFELYNLYGPTEDAIWTSYAALRYDKANTVYSIGRPIANKRVYILNADHQLQPVGVPGELCISGAGLARGYVNSDALTKERFVADPFFDGERMYKTGDMACWLPDGNICFIGRKDNQVKIRGFRIEPGEIENTLAAYAPVQDVVVAVLERGDHKYLAAYYTAAEAIAADTLKDYLLARLPAYMVPAYFVHLPSIPLTPNGKADRKRLPDPGITASAQYEAASTPIGTKLVEIWSEVLHLDRDKIGINTNFFDLGGHSISLMALNSRINDAFGCNLSVAGMFRLPTISSQEQYLMNGDADLSALENRLEQDLNEAGAVLDLLQDGPSGANE